MQPIIHLTFAILAASAPVPTNFWTVQLGDTGYAIASALDVPFDAIAQANPGVGWDDLQVGQEIAVPTDFASPDQQQAGRPGGRDGTVDNMNGVVPIERRAELLSFSSLLQ
jgi:LysM repeat protein